MNSTTSPASPSSGTQSPASPSHALSAVRDTFFFALATIGQQRLPLLVALAVGIAFPILIHTRERATVALVVAFTIAYSAAVSFGVRTLRANPQRSFSYSRPAATAALWWGTFIAAIATALLMGLAVLAPVLLMDALRSNSADLGLGIFWLAVGLPLTVLASHGLMSLFESESNWRFLGPPMIVLVGAAFYLTYSALALKNMSGRALGIDGFNPAQAIVLIILAVALHVGLLFGAHLRATRGRLDERRGHRLFAISLWALLLVGAAASAGLAYTLLSPDLPDQEITLIDTHPSEHHPWITVGAGRGDPTGNWLDQLHSLYGSWYAVNTDTGEYRRLENLERHSPYRSNATTYTQSGDTLFLPSGSSDDLLLTQLNLMTGEIAESKSPLVHGPRDQWWVSPNGKAAIDAIHDWNWDQGLPAGFPLTVQTTEMGTLRPLASYKTAFNPTGSSWGDGTRNQFRRTTLVWKTDSAADLTVDSSHGNFFRAQIDLRQNSSEKGSSRRNASAKVSITPTALVRLDPRFLEERSPKELANFSRPTWSDDHSELWIATGPRIQAYTSVLSEDLQAPSRTIFTAKEGHEIFFYQRVGDRLTVITKDTVKSFGTEYQTQQLDENFYGRFRDLTNTVGEAILLDRSAEGIWEPISSLALKPLLRPTVKLDAHAYLLSPAKVTRLNQRGAEVLDFSNGQVRQISVAQWLVQKNLPASEGIFPATRNIYALDDDSFWTFHHGTQELRKLNLPAPIRLDYRWRSRL